MELKFEDKFYIEGRGVIFTVKFPKEGLKRGDKVRIDNANWVINDIEVFRSWPETPLTNKTVGLLVKLDQ